MLVTINLKNDIYYGLVNFIDVISKIFSANNHDQTHRVIGKFRVRDAGRNLSFLAILPLVFFFFKSSLGPLNLPLERHGLGNGLYIYAI